MRAPADLGLRYLPFGSILPFERLLLLSLAAGGIVSGSALAVSKHGDDDDDEEAGGGKWAAHKQTDAPTSEASRAGVNENVNSRERHQSLHDVASLWRQALSGAVDGRRSGRRVSRVGLRRHSARGDGLLAHSSSSSGGRLRAAIELSK